VISQEMLSILERGRLRVGDVTLRPVKARARPNAISQAAYALMRLMAVLLVSVSAAAQYRFNLWTAENGLPLNSVRGLLQTPDGYLWIATLDGVARFGGSHFKSFNKSNTPGIVSNRIDSMVGGQDGDLWMVTENGRITRYHNGSFQTYGEKQGLREDNPVHGITSDDFGHVWILFADTISQWDEAAGRFSDITVKLPQVQYFKSLRWGHPGFWGWNDKGLHCFIKGQWIDVPLPTWLPASSIWEVAVDQKRTLWLETLKGQHVSITAGKAVIQKAGATVDYVDRQGHVWKMRIGHQLDRSMEGTTFGANPPGPFTQVIEDHEGSLWLATEGRGLYRLHRQFVHVYSKEQGLIDSNVYPIYQDHSGVVWIGAWRGGLSRFEAGKFTSYTVANGLPNPLVTSLYEDRDGQLWVATYKGLCIVVNGRLRKPSGPALPEQTVVQVIQQDRRGALWFGTPEGLVKYSNGITQIFTTRDGLATNDVHAIVESQSGDLWIGGYGGLTKIRGGEFTNSTEHYGSPSDSIRSLYEDHDGVLWIGTYDNGLGRLKDGQLTRYNVRDGLFSNGVFQTLEDTHGNLWISSNWGIYRVRKQDLNEYAAKKINAITSVAYGTIDGMLNAECNGGFGPAGIKTRDGKMWFPTQNGVAVIDPETVPHNEQPPPVVIESSQLDRVELPVTGPLQIAPGKQNLEIQYNALSFIKSDLIQFRYKMDGLDADWIDVGSRRTAYYSHMPSGKYVFQVIARNSDGVWNNIGQSLPVVVLAPFYKTGTFLTFLLLLGAALIWVVASYRITRLQRAQIAQHRFSQQLIASQEGERKRIAAELHDSLGQRLVVINNLALFFLRSHAQHSSDDKQAETIKEISAEASSAIEETRSIAYNLRPFQLDRLGLTKSIEGLIRTVSKSSGIHIASDLANVDELFPEELRINFYRIVQEALSNIMKHAEATEVNVHILRTDTNVVLSIQDNGRGFTPAARTAQVGHGGFGLTGMTERATLLGGRLKVRSEPGSGTMMTVEIPLVGADHAE
jgi:signal transduction histidine kinase/ligand-binding sensor domain-containing protein